MRKVILQEFVSLDGRACTIVLGEGKPLFHDRIDPGGLKLLESISFDRGTVLLAYAPAEVST